MAFEAGDIRVAGNATIYVAPVGTAFPAFGVAPAAPWLDLGYVTEDGITANYGREITEIYAMQSVEPVRIIATRMPKTIAFALMQQGRLQFELAMGGGEWAADGAATDVFRFTPPDPSVVDEKAMLVVFSDGGFTYQFEYKRVQNREGVETKMVREDALTFPVTMQILMPTTGTVPFEVVTDDTAYAAAALLDADGNPIPSGNGNGDPQPYDPNAPQPQPTEPEPEPAPTYR